MVVIQGRIATHDADPRLGQITIGSDGLISDVTYDRNRFVPEPDQRFSDDNLIFAGFGDVHIHAREDDSGIQIYKEEYLTALNAALNGGVVHVAAMPNTPRPVVNRERFKWHRDRIRELDHLVTALNYVGIDDGGKPIGFPGEHPYKVYFGKSVGDLSILTKTNLARTLRAFKAIPRSNIQELETMASSLEALNRALKQPQPNAPDEDNFMRHVVSKHIEYEPIVRRSKHGRTHSDRRPVECVDLGLEYDLPIIESTGMITKLCHWSTGLRSFDMIAEHRKKARENGLPYTTIEVSPLHLLFDSSMTDDDLSLWLKIQMNPAVQGPEHRKALIDGLRDKFVDYLATDHAPHTEEEKYVMFAKFRNEDAKRFGEMTNVQIARYFALNDHAKFLETCCENGTSGAPWLDTYANVCVWLMDRHDFKPQDIARIAAYNPGVFTNQFLQSQFDSSIDFGKGFGKIEKGYVGSLTVLNVNKPQTISRETLQTKPQWSPLEGYTFTGGLEAVIIRGKNVTGQYQRAA